MRRSMALGLVSGLAVLLLGCGSVPGDGTAPGVLAEPGRPVATAGDVRFSLPTPHRVVAERRTTSGWGDPRVVFEDRGRECGAVDAVAAGSTVAATVDCDDHYAEDQAPTRSVALVSTDARSWAHRDLEGEAFTVPGLAPGGDHAVWVQGADLLTWADGSFGTAPPPSGSPQVVTVDDDGAIVAVRVRTTAGRCVVEVRSGGDDPQVVPVAPARSLLCSEAGLALATPSELRGDVSGQTGTEFAVRRAASSTWALAVRPPITAPGLDVYPDDASRAVWNQLTVNAGGDLVAVGSPDRRRVTAQRYDRARQRWTPSRVVHVAAGPTCRRRVDDSGLLQGATFRLRLFCDGRPVVLRSRTGAAWTTQGSG